MAGDGVSYDPGRFAQFLSDVADAWSVGAHDQYQAEVREALRDVAAAIEAIDAHLSGAHSASGVAGAAVMAGTQSRVGGAMQGLQQDLAEFVQEADAAAHVVGDTDREAAGASFGGGLR